MKDLLDFIVKSLVTKPEAVFIEEHSQEGDVTLNLTVDPTDMGLIIGKSGQTIRSIRKLLTVRAIAENVRINLQLTEPNVEDKKGEEKNDESSEEPEKSELGTKS